MKNQQKNIIFKEMNLEMKNHTEKKLWTNEDEGIYKEGISQILFANVRNVWI